MSNYDKYVDVFVKTFDIDKGAVENLAYQEIQAWDSVGHMGLIAAIEETFDIMMDTEDIIDFSSFQKGKEILSSKYGVEF